MPWHSIRTWRLPRTMTALPGKSDHTIPGPSTTQQQQCPSLLFQQPLRCRLLPDVLPGPERPGQSCGSKPCQPDVLDRRCPTDREWNRRLQRPSGADQEGTHAVLRMHTESTPKVLSRLHHSEHSLRTHSLHCLGEAPVQVRDATSESSKPTILY